MENITEDNHPHNQDTIQYKISEISEKAKDDIQTIMEVEVWPPREELSMVDMTI